MTITKWLGRQLSAIGLWSFLITGVLYFVCSYQTFAEVQRGIKAPTYGSSTSGNAWNFYANGTPIVISSDPARAGCTQISWSGGSISGITEVQSSRLFVYGGGNETVNGDTSITMTGGSVHSIAGGCFQDGAVVNGNVNIMVSGGSVDEITGNGYNSIGCYSKKINGDVNITVSGGTALSIVGSSEMKTEVIPAITGNTSIRLQGGTVREVQICMSLASRYDKGSIYLSGNIQAPSGYPYVNILAGGLTNGSIHVVGPLNGSSSFGITDYGDNFEMHDWDDLVLVRADEPEYLDASKFQMISSYNNSKQEAIQKVIQIATEEIGYIEKASNQDLDSKTGNAGFNNYTKYWRDVYPAYQAQSWCACFVTWVFDRAFGKTMTKQLLKHYPFVYCPTMGNLFSQAQKSVPEVGDIVLFKRNGIFVHTGIVVGVNGDTFTTIEGNTSGGSTIIPNDGEVCRKTYNIYSLSGTRFCTVNWNLVGNTNPYPTTPVRTFYTQGGDLLIVGLPKEGWIREHNQYHYYVGNVLQVDCWVRTDGIWYYVDEEGNRKVGWVQWHGLTYYMNTIGEMQTGLVTIEGKLYCFPQERGGAMVTGWRKQNEKWYYFGFNGIAYQNLQVIGNNSFYFDPVTCIMASSCWRKYNDNWYYFESGGYMHLGWLERSGCRYYCDENGVMRTGWQKLDGKLYYLGAQNSGVMKKNTWMTNEGNDYYLGAEGYAVAGWQYIDQKIYYFNGNCVLQTGWQTIDGNTFYFEPNRGGMLNGQWKFIDGFYYHFDKLGVREKGWLILGNYRYYLAADGKMQTGWQTIDGVVYYLGASNSGVMSRGWKYIEDSWYYFDPNGKRMSGILTLGNYSYYFGTEGNMQTGWQKIGEDSYYFGSANSGVMSKGWKKIDGIWYYFEASGKQCFGWKEIGSNTYYLDLENNGQMVIGTMVIDGVTYQFANSGALLVQATAIPTPEAALTEGALQKNQSSLVDLNHDGTAEMVSYQEKEGCIEILVDNQFIYRSKAYPQWQTGSACGMVLIRNFADKGSYLEILMTQTAEGRAEHTMLSMNGNRIQTWNLQEGGIDSSEITILGKQMFGVTVKTAGAEHRTTEETRIYLVNEAGLTAVSGQAVDASL